jgi:hypothetical protein
MTYEYPGKNSGSYLIATEMLHFLAQCRDPPHKPSSQFRLETLYKDSVTEYDEWDHIFRIPMLVLFQYVMRNWRSSATATLGINVTLHTTSSLQFCSSHMGGKLI